MRIATAIAVLIATSVFLPKAAQAENPDKFCGFYSKVGSVVAEEMLPMTFQDLINAVSGKDDKSMEKMVGAIQEKINPAEIVAVSRLSQDDLKLFSESAGQVAFELLLTFQVSSASELEETMLSSCQKVGYKQIIENQKQANKATQKNVGN